MVQYIFTRNAGGWTFSEAPLPPVQGAVAGPEPSDALSFAKVKLRRRTQQQAAGYSIKLRAATPP